MSARTASFKKPQTKKVTQIIKIVVPHIGLYALLFAYLMFGTWAFSRLEYRAEIVHQQERLTKIEDVYRQISGTLREECSGFSEEDLYGSLSKLSSFMEGKSFKLFPHKQNDVRSMMPLKWDSTSSLLYALSILTTTGLGLAPLTTAGKILTIAYGFVGIPLMFLAAVDLGRFLSDVVIKFYAKAEQAQKKLANLCGFPKKNAVISLETTALKVLTPIKRRSINRFAKKTRKSKKKESNKKRLPLAVNGLIILLFCMFGGVVYTAAGGNQKNFIGAFFVTFNLVANLTMSEMPSDISQILTLVYITIFVTFGLAVLSMCAELAAIELKWIFIRIHYFGRRINWKRKSAAKKEEHMNTELNELLKIIGQIRAKYPEKQEITSIDILKYMEELNPINSYLTFSMFMQQLRRDTIAFMPQSIEALKFADDNDMDDTTSQHFKAEEEKVETQSVLNSGLGFSAYDV